MCSVDHLHRAGPLALLVHWMFCDVHSNGSSVGPGVVYPQQRTSVAAGVGPWATASRERGLFFPPVPEITLYG